MVTPREALGFGLRAEPGEMVAQVVRGDPVDRPVTAPSDPDLEDLLVADERRGGELFGPFELKEAEKRFGGGQTWFCCERARGAVIHSENLPEWGLLKTIARRVISKQVTRRAMIQT